MCVVSISCRQPLLRNGRWRCCSTRNLPPPRLSYYVAGRTGMPAFSSEIDDEGKTMSAGRTCLLSRISPTSFHLRRQPAVLSVDKQQPRHFGKVHHPGRVVMLAGRFQSARARDDDKRKKARENMRVGFFSRKGILPVSARVRVSFSQRWCASGSCYGGRPCCLIQLVIWRAVGSSGRTQIAFCVDWCAVVNDSLRRTLRSEVK